MSEAKTSIVYWGLSNARATLPTMLAAFAGQELVWDETTANTWPACKGESPFGQLPFLKDGDHTVGQSMAIVRYLGKKYGLQGEGAAFALSEMLTEEFNDIFAAMAKTKGSIETAVKFFEEVLPKHLTLLEKLCPAEGYFGGEKGLQGDVAIAAALFNISCMSDEHLQPVLAKFTNLSAWYARMVANEGVAKWLVSMKDKNPYFTYPEEEKKSEDNLVLYYWNGRGAMETTRALLALADKFPGAGYEDHRDPKAEGLDLGSANCGRVPLIRHNGVDIGQSGAIQRYIAKITGALGANDLEAAQIEAIDETVKEIKGAYFGLSGGYPGPHKEEDEKKRGELLDLWFNTAAEEGLPAKDKRQLRWWLSKVEANVGADGFAVGAKLSLADAVIYNTLAEFDAAADDSDASGSFGNKARTDKIVADFPKIAKIIATFGAAPGVAKWHATRGKQGF